MIEPFVIKQISDGVQKIYTFTNGYGASVVRHSFSYGGKRGLWELAVLTIQDKEPLKFELCYSTDITNDVMGHLTNEDVEIILNDIKKLKGDGE